MYNISNEKDVKSLIKNLLDKGIPKIQIAKILNVNRNTLNKYIKENNI